MAQLNTMAACLPTNFAFLAPKSELNLCPDGVACQGRLSSHELLEQCLERVGYHIMGREDAIEYAKKHNVPVPVTKKSIYSRDGNLWHLSHEVILTALF